MTTGTCDAVVVGAGPNGLVAANLLVDAGWDVLVLEAQPTPGGAVRSDSEVHPGFVHDTFSAFYPLAVASQAMRSLRLEEHGLVWEHAPAVLGHPFGDGRWSVLHRDRHDTATGLDELRAGDGDAWLELCRTWDRIGPALVDGLTTPFPPIRAGARLLPAVARTGGLDTVRRLATPVASLGRELFSGPAAQLLLAGNAGHADFPLSSPGSGVFGVLMTMLGQTVGFPVPRGGAQRLDRRAGRAPHQRRGPAADRHGGDGRRRPRRSRGRRTHPRRGGVRRSRRARRRLGDAPLRGPRPRRGPPRPRRARDA